MIIGGVVRVIPLTGVTLPFVSYGGSSVVANMILVALLLLISDRARRPSPDAQPLQEPGPGAEAVNAPILRVFVLFLVLFAALVGFSSYWAVFDADELEATGRQPALADRDGRRSGAGRSAAPTER